MHVFEFMFLPANNMRINRKRKKPIKTRRRSWQWKLRPLLVVSTTKHPPSCVTTATEAILQWGDNKYIKTIPLGTRNNVATLYSSPGYDKFQTFCSEAELSNNDTDNVITCEECTSVIADKDNEPIHAEPTTILHYNKDDHRHFDQSVDDAIMSRMTL